MRQLTRSRDVVAGAVIAALGLVYVVAALQIRPDPSAASVLGPRVAPLVIGGLTVVFALVLVVQGVRAARAPSDDGTAEPAEHLRPAAAERSEPSAPTVPAEPAAAGEPVEIGDLPEPEPVDLVRVLVSFGLLAAYVVAFIPVGFLLSTVAFLVALTTYVDRDKVLRNCIFAIVFAPAVYALFEYGLGVRLPPGVLGFGSTS